MNKTKVEKLHITENFRNNPVKHITKFGVPERFKNNSFDNFKGNNKLVKSVRDYVSISPLQSLAFLGNCGAGKTHLAVAIVRYFIEKGVGLQKIPIKQNMSLGEPENYEYINYDLIHFTTVPELLARIRDTYNRSKQNQESWNNENTELSIIDKYSNHHLLILDDLGAEKSTEWSITTLYLIIDRRYRDCKPTIVTSNLSLQEIENKLDARIASRLGESKVIEIDMPDYRKRILK